jgi:hypothetical protein
MAFSVSWASYDTQSIQKDVRWLYAILYKELKHPQILVSGGGSGINPQDIKERLYKEWVCTTASQLLDTESFQR